MKTKKITLQLAGYDRDSRSFRQEKATFYYDWRPDVTVDIDLESIPNKSFRDILEFIGDSCWGSINGDNRININIYNDNKTAADCILEKDCSVRMRKIITAYQLDKEVACCSFLFSRIEPEQGPIDFLCREFDRMKDMGTTRVKILHNLKGIKEFVLN